MSFRLAAGAGDHAQRSASKIDVLRTMSKTSVEVDQDIVREAAAILGTRTLRNTIDAALREVVHAKRRLELVALLSQEGRFDFEAAEGAWGTDA
jgi:Arc/MetJ family transcription regulator